MNVHFWGVRGSLPTPLTPLQVKAKISAVVRHMRPEDAESEESKERYLESLPEWIYGTVGGNTPCVELDSADGTKIVFDAGTGLRTMGKLAIPQENLHYNLIFSHFHWDHIQGLPFFDHAYNPKAKFDVYSPFEDMEAYLRNQMVQPYYPVPFGAFTKNFEFHRVEPGDPFSVGNLNIVCAEMAHPGKSYSYRVEEKIEGEVRSFVYATDVELSLNDFVESPEKAKVFRDADSLVIDSQYTADEAIRKAGWGHSPFCYAIDFAIMWNIRDVYFFHHEPTYDDRKLHTILGIAREYAATSKREGRDAVGVHLAVEGLSLSL